MDKNNLVFGVQGYKIEAPLESPIKVHLDLVLHGSPRMSSGAATRLFQKLAMLFYSRLLFKKGEIFIVSEENKKS